MVEVECAAKKWGSSIGIVIPKDIVDKECIEVDDRITVDIRKGVKAREVFGLLSDWKRPTSEIIKEARKGWR